MKKVFGLIIVLGLLAFMAVAAAAPVAEPVQEIDMIADRAVTPIDYSFFDKPSPGKIELSNLNNLYGAGAGIIIYLNTDTGGEWLVLKFDGGIVQASLQNKKIALLSESQNALRTKPLVITVDGEKLTLAAGGKSRTVQGVYDFKGSLTTQSISGKIKAYVFTDK